MITLLKILTFILIGFLAYDTVDFVYEDHKASEDKKQVELRPNYEAMDISRPSDKPDVLMADEDVFLGVGFFVFITGVAGLLMMYFTRGRSDKTIENSELTLRRVPEEHYLSYFYNENRAFSKDDPRLIKNFSEIQLSLAPHSYTPPEGGRSFDKMNALEREFEKYSEKTQHPFEVTTDEEEGDDEDIIDVNLLSNNTSLSVQKDTTKRDTTVTQTDSSLVCDCNLDQFEERLGAVEHGLKTSREATNEWSKRIEQAEVDLVNLHRQMYTILSKAEFVPPSSDLFAKNIGSSTPTDFYEPTLYRVPDIIVETKRELEQGDLFRKSMSKLHTDDNWSRHMEAELAEKIKELTLNDSEQQQDKEQSLSTTGSDPSKIKDALLKKNTELKEKTRGIFRAMEEAVKATQVRRNKLSVHSHFVAPYRRIQHADNDNSVSFNGQIQQQNNKFKIG